MATPVQYRKRIQELKREFEKLKTGKDKLLQLIDEAEIAESVYNSNAIENSTLTLKETEKILLEQEVSRNLSIREVYEARNLASVIEYIRGQSEKMDISQEVILSMHQILMTGIDSSIAGRFRTEGEYVRVGTYIAPAPENIERMLENTLLNYQSDNEKFFSDNISWFHLEFEHIHPFNDGNGRIGRALINYQLLRLGFPPIIIRNKGKAGYYSAFVDYQERKDVKKMERTIALALIESLHKRLAYLSGDKIIKVAEYAKQTNASVNTLLNAARRQTIPAFREKGTWMIGEES